MGLLMKKKVSVGICLLIIGVLTSLVVFAGYYENKSISEYRKEVFSTLKKMRIEKKEIALRLLNDQYKLATELVEDSYVHNLFIQMMHITKDENSNSRKIKDFEYLWERLFAERLSMFYDILLIDSKGDIFFTIKRESDYHRNIDDPIFAKSQLRNAINSPSREVEYVNYEYYLASNEPASFFIVPIYLKNQKVGSIVLQQSINMINRALMQGMESWKTGETYLVNEKRWMLTQSRFIDEDSILRKKIETNSVLAALKGQSGENVVIDYRGIQVLSSFEKFEFLGTTWIILSEVDENEIVTDFYKQSKDESFDAVVRYLEENSVREVKDRSLFEDVFKRSDKIKVDINEYGFCRSQSQVIYTLGVATCTAIVIHMPQKFGYLMHISPTDEIYEPVSAGEQLFLGHKSTDIIGTVMERLNYFNIYPFQQSLLKATIFATHPESLKKSIDKLISYGLDLSQIKVMYQPQYRSLNVYVDYYKDEVWSMWRGGESGSALFRTEKLIDLGEVISRTAN